MVQKNSRVWLEMVQNGTKKNELLFKNNLETTLWEGIYIL